MSSKAHAQKVSKTSTIFLVAGLGAAIIFGAIGWNIWQNSRVPELPSQVNGTGIGKVAPDFSVPTLDGKTFTLSEQRGKPTVIFFMAYWCGSCIPEGTALGQIIQEYGNKVSIVAINIDPSATWDTINQFKQAAGNGAFAWAWDTDQKVTTAYQVTALDTTLILDGEGRIVYRDELPTQYETLKAELEKLTQ